jgi:hypothetical protein
MSRLVTRCDEHDIEGEELSVAHSAPCVVCGMIVGGIDQPKGHTRWLKDDPVPEFRSIPELRAHADKVPGYGHLVAHEMVDEIERLRLKVAYYHTSTCPEDDCQECSDSEALIKTSPLPEE